MPSYSRGSVVLIRFPFSDLTSAKVRPGIIISAPHPSQDIFVVPLTSKLSRLQPGEFELHDWQAAGLNVGSAVKRGIFTVHRSLIIKEVGTLSARDTDELEKSLRTWTQL